MAQKLLDRTLDTSLTLCDGMTLTSTTGVFTQVGGANASIYLGTATADFDVVIDATSVDVSQTNHVYSFYVVGGATAGSQTYTLGMTTLGKGAAAGSVTDRQAGRYVIRCNNVAAAASATYAGQDLVAVPWISMICQPGGTSPSISFKAYVVKRS